MTYTTTGATYYVSSTTGSDANSGLSSTSPWQTLSKVNAAALKAGDRVLFRRGDTFFGTLNIGATGASGNPLVYGAYGTGNKPLITGFRTLSGWVNEGNGIYSATTTTEGAVNFATLDGANTAMGRYPNAAYLNFESAGGNSSITDIGLGSSGINWTGAEAVIRKNDWTLDRCRITSQSGDTLYYTNLGTGQSAEPNFGYFIQNDLRTLDRYGEWYHQPSTGKFYMYFGTVDPNTRTVRVPALRNLVNCSSSFVIIDGLAITGAIDYAISFSGASSQSNVVQNSDVSFYGIAAIYSRSVNTSIIANTLTESAAFGIYMNASGARITHNRFSNIGVLEGQSLHGGNSAIFYASASNSVTQNNVIENVGYHGVYLNAGSNISVKNNFINNVCLMLNDCGGIYTAQPSTNFIIEGNIVLNSIGSTRGGAGNPLLAEGIYLDEFASGIIVRNNTIAGSSNGAMKLHKGSNNLIQNNLTYNNGRGIDLFNSLTTAVMSGNSLTGNQFIARTATQRALNCSTFASGGCRFGTADYNYYARPIKDDYSIRTYAPGISTEERTLATWQSYSGLDANSKKSPQAITSDSDLQFEYNATSSPRTVTLSRPMIDVKGTKYSGSIMLQPFTSILLMRDANP